MQDRPLIKTTEGRILLCGIAGVGIYLLFLLLSWFSAEEWHRVFVSMTFSNLVFGRAAGITIGYASGLSTFYVVLINFAVEMLTVLVVYPLFVFSWNRMLHIESLKRVMLKQHRFAEDYHDKIKKYGLYGLFAFVWFPFWMTGPAIGCMIGYLMGLRHLVTLSVVLGSTLLAMIGWAFFLHLLQNWAESIDPQAPWLIVAIVVLIAVVGTVVRYRQKES